MSHSQDHFSEPYDSEQEQGSLYYAPRKFVFDTDDKDRNSKNNTAEVRSLKKNAELEQFMPFIFSFPEPTNYKEGYSQLSKQIIGVYNHLRVLLVEDHCSDLKEFVKDVKVTQAGDCLALVREVLNGCCEKLRSVSKHDSEDGPADPVKDYEELLQKAEAKIRILIRNEQIFRLNFDILTQKCEDMEKEMQQAQRELESKKQSYEIVVKENLAVTNKLHSKETELKKTLKDMSNLEKKLKEMTTTVAMLETINAANAVEHSKSLTHSYHQNFNLGVLENKSIPTDYSDQIDSNMMRKSSWSNLKPPATQGRPESSKTRQERRAPTPGMTNYTEPCLSPHRREKSQQGKNGLFQEPKKKMPNRNALNASLDVMLNKSRDASQERRSYIGVLPAGQKKVVKQVVKKESVPMQIKAKLQEQLKSLNDKNKGSHSYLNNKNSVLQVFQNGAQHSKHENNVSTRATSNGKSRGNSAKKGRAVQTEVSPEREDKFPESQMFYTHARTNDLEVYKRPNANNPRKKPSPKRVQSKDTNDSSSIIKHMIAEQLRIKLQGKK